MNTRVRGLYSGLYGFMDEEARIYYVAHAGEFLWRINWHYLEGKNIYSQELYKSASGPIIDGCNLAFDDTVPYVVIDDSEYYKRFV